MRHWILAGIVLAAGCSQPVQRVATRESASLNPEAESEFGFPLWVNHEQVPEELLCKRTVDSSPWTYESYQESVARYERETTCYFDLMSCPVTATEVNDSALAQLAKSLSAGTLKKLDSNERDALMHAIEQTPDSYKHRRRITFRSYECGGCSASYELESTETLHGLVFAGKPIEIDAESCRLVFAMQGVEQPLSERAAGPWYASDDVRMSVGEYGAKLATSPVPGETVVVVVGVQKIARPEPWPAE